MMCRHEVSRIKRALWPTRSAISRNVDRTIQDLLLLLEDADINNNIISLLLLLLLLFISSLSIWFVFSRSEERQSSGSF
jgi:hypothetical protein